MSGDKKEKTKWSFLKKTVVICSGITTIGGALALLLNMVPDFAFAEDVDQVRVEVQKDIGSFKAEYYQDRADRTFEQLINVQLMQKEYTDKGEPVPDLLVEKEQLLQRKMQDYEKRVEKYEAYVEENL